MTAPDEPGTVDVGAMQKRARLGVILLAARTAIVQVGVLVGGVVMARLLEPEDFGVYVICVFALKFFGFFGDGGLGGALIQKKEEPTQTELSTVFWASTAIALAVVAGAWIFAAYMPVVWPGIPASGPRLLRILAFEFLLVSLRAVPTLLLERQLGYTKLSIVETIRDLSYYFAALPLAYYGGLGVYAIGLGILVEGTVGVVGAFAARPWLPSLAFDRAALRPLLAFGLAYQGSRVITLANDAVMPLYAGARLGAASAGLLNWARETASFPLKLVDILSRVTFPMYAQLQDRPAVLAETLGRATYLCGLLTGALVGMFYGMGEPFVRIVWTEKWLAARLEWRVYLAATCFAFLAPLVSSACDALGKPRIFVRLAAAWTALNWIAVVIGTRWGRTGFAIAHSVHMVVGFVAVVVVLSQVIPGARLARRLAPCAVGGVAAYVAARACASHVAGPLTLVGSVLVVLLACGLSVLLVDRRGLRDAIALVPKQ